MTAAGAVDAIKSRACWIIHRRRRKMFAVSKNIVVDGPKEMRTVRRMHRIGKEDQT